MRALALLPLAIVGCHAGPPGPVVAERGRMLEHSPDDQGVTKTIALPSPTSPGTPSDKPFRAEAPRTPRAPDTGRAGVDGRDYAIRVGMGFSAEETLLLERAAASWRRVTGLPIHLRHGYGPLGNFHIAESIPVCGQRWVYDGYLGCYSPSFDSVVLNRFGIELEEKERPGLLYIILLHEMGHWLGLPHAEEGEDSIMLPDYPHLAERPDDLSALSDLDVEAVCRLNPCSALSPVHSTEPSDG